MLFSVNQGVATAVNETSQNTSLVDSIVTNVIQMLHPNKPIEATREIIKQIVVKR